MNCSPALSGPASLVREGRVNPWLFGNHPMMPPPVPNGYRWSLPLLYLVFAVVVAILYVACRWFDQWKARRQGASRAMELSTAGPQARSAQL